jgi:hypothetical protein
MVLAASFWLFSYTFLALRKFLAADDLSVAISIQRVIAISAGAVAYWLVVRQIESAGRIRLKTVIGWVAGAALAMIAVRVGLSNLFTDEPVPLARSLRWTLTWSAYFGLWVVGAVAYLAPAQARAEAVPAVAAVPRPVAAAAPRTGLAKTELDELSLLIEAIALEASELNPTDRQALAERVLRFGRYEVVGDDDWSRSQSVRARFAWGLALRLSRD